LLRKLVEWWKARRAEKNWWNERMTRTAYLETKLLETQLKRERKELELIKLNLRYFKAFEDLERKNKKTGVV
jgi:hypothetical protein